MTPRPEKISVLILTLNEEAILERCLASVQWADEVLVIDSNSEDSTREIAASRGARVVEQSWLGWSAQRTAATDAASNDWVMFVEADEVVTPRLARSIQERLSDCPDVRNAFSVDRHTEWLGKLLPNDQRRSLVKSFVRVFNRKFSAYDPDMVVHERVVVPGVCVLLEGKLIHWRSESLSLHTDRAIKYSSLEAELSKSFHGRAPRLSRLAVMPLLRFMWVAVARRNIWFGTLGILHALHKANAEWMRQACEFEFLSRQDWVLQVRDSAFSEVSDRRTNLTSTIEIWMAGPRLIALGLAAVVGRDPAPKVLAKYLAWNRRWLTAGRNWERRNVVHLLHPPESAVGRDR